MPAEKLSRRRLLGWPGCVTKSAIKRALVQLDFVLIVYDFYSDVLTDGAYAGLVLEFTLPPSSYATMALREITKMDMSARFQTSLNEAGGTKVQERPQQQQTQQQTRRNSNAEEPDSKRAKKEPGT